MKTYVIAEAGANHDCNFSQALKLIDVAVAAGASACKFQTYSSHTLYSRNTPDFAGYENINELIDKIALNRDWQQDLKAYCDSKQIEFLSTPFDALAVEQLMKIGVKRFKIAGFEASDLHFVKMVATTKLPLIISAGIGVDFTMIARIIEACAQVGNENLTFLHCNNAYPTPQQDINLATMVAIGKAFPYPIGLSDHSLSPLTPAFAVSLGADVIEKHFTLSKQLQGPDHAFALEPEQLVEMVNAIQLAEQSLGMKQSIYTDSEQSFQHARRSVVSKIKLHYGDNITQDQITTKRPFFNGNVAAYDYEMILGKRLNRDVNTDTPLLWEWIDK